MLNAGYLICNYNIAINLAHATRYLLKHRQQHLCAGYRNTP